MEHVKRREAALELAAAAGADILLVTKLTHIRYLTGFTGTAGVLLLAPEPLLVVDFRYGAQARQQVPDIPVDGDCAPPRLWATATDRLAARPGTRVGVDPRNLTAEQYLALAVALGPERLVDCAGLVEGLRAVKDADEIAALTDAADLAEELVRRLPGWLRPGRAENEIAGEIEYAQRHLGAERSAATILVSSGERSTMPHGAASDKPLREGEPVLVDLSPVVRGYRADITRSFYLGTAPPEYRRLHQAVTEAHGEAMAAVRAGVRASAVDAVARGVLARYELDGFFNHSLGHGIGLDQHEPPLLSPYDDTVLRAGMVVMIEPGVYVPGVGGTRIEDAVLVTETGCTPLTTSDTGIREL
ncbi:Xaa-Pro peptidase family protein [Phytohabitans sp. ZYX-F-186]|uniref:Xaa-Pro peptidase family protein n=1 Tax=Phytohabitans maris TaxID=3071409 RepID=A0ABU0ZN69_9ACTN|nr:Xaa-Pro peptidase family protein [Phytohabitans sp. ZYX-F-186]MDQ7908479.1 Xaa-Pro peptidase family protein [Phytohabitans sp. ZYX-F-186]